MKLFKSKKAEGDSWSTFTVGELTMSVLIVFGLFFISSHAFSSELIQSNYFTQDITASADSIYALNGDAVITFPEEDPNYGIVVDQNKINVNYYVDGQYDQRTNFIFDNTFSMDKSNKFNSYDGLSSIGSFIIKKSGDTVYLGKEGEVTTQSYINLNKQDFIPLKLENLTKLDFFEIGFGQTINKKLLDENRVTDLVILISDSYDTKTKISYSSNGKPNLDFIAEKINAEFKKAKENLDVLEFYDDVFEKDLRLHGNNVILIEISDSLLSSVEAKNTIPLLAKIVAGTLNDLLED